MDVGGCWTREKGKFGEIAVGLEGIVLPLALHLGTEGTPAVMIRETRGGYLSWS